MNWIINHLEFKEDTNTDTELNYHTEHPQFDITTSTTSNHNIDDLTNELTNKLTLHSGFTPSNDDNGNSLISDNIFNEEESDDDDDDFVPFEYEILPQDDSDIQESDDLTSQQVI